MTEVEKAYLAGLVDGEGTITLSRHHKGQNPQPRLAISNNCLSVLEWARSVTGKGLIIRRSPRKEWHRQSYVWQVCLAGAVLEILAEIRPYLRIKQRHASLLLDEYKACTPRNGKYSGAVLALKGKLIETMRALNEEQRSRSPIRRQAPAASAAG